MKKVKQTTKKGAVEELSISDDEEESKGGKKGKAKKGKGKTQTGKKKAAPKKNQN